MEEWGSKITRENKSASYHLILCLHSHCSSNAGVMVPKVTLAQCAFPQEALQNLFSSRISDREMRPFKKLVPSLLCIPSHEIVAYKGRWLTCAPISLVFFFPCLIFFMFTTRCPRSPICANERNLRREWQCRSRTQKIRSKD